jgi:hypothetical protein
MALPLKLQLAEGFREVAPRPCGHRLLWEEGGNFRYTETDFLEPRNFGHLGPVDCPLAVDAARGLAWAYCCQYRLGVRDYSEIREFNLATGRSRRALRLGVRQWALWLLAHWPGSDSLLALVATDTRVDAINIRHHLAVIDTKKAQLHLIALPHDAFAPLAYCPRRRWIIFHGVEGTHLVSFAGRNLLTLPSGGPLGRGGDIHPHKPFALIGGDGIWLWNLESGAVSRLRERGQYPRWAPDGTSCWFSESSSDLFQMNCETGAEERLLRVAGHALTEVNYARPIAADAAGRYLALPLTRLLKMDPLAVANAPTLARLHRLCVVDLTAREVWLAEGYARHLAWA